MFPCAILSATQVMVYLIPSMDSSSDRIGFGTTNMLSMVVFQTVLQGELPKTSDAVTALSKYIIALIILSACGIFESIVVERLRRINSRPPPKRLTMLLAHCRPALRNRTIHDIPNISLTPSGEISGLSRHNSNASSYGDENRLTEQRHHEMERNDQSRSSHLSVPLPKSHFGRTLTIPQFEMEDMSYVGQSNGGGLQSTATSQIPDGVFTNQEGRTTISKRNRKISKFTAARDLKARRQFIEQHYSELWNEVATAVDIFCFIFSTLSAILVPVGLFVPLVSFNNSCPQA